MIQLQVVYASFATGKAQYVLSIDIKM